MQPHIFRPILGSLTHKHIQLHALSRIVASSPLRHCTSLACVLLSTNLPVCSLSQLGNTCKKCKYYRYLRKNAISVRCCCCCLMWACLIRVFKLFYYFSTYFLHADFYRHCCYCCIDVFYSPTVFFNHFYNVFGDS